jgi:hypothetical protein
MSDHLQTFIYALEPDATDPDATIGAASSAQPSIFWLETVKDIRQMGSNAAAGVHAQFSNFEKNRPG